MKINFNIETGVNSVYKIFEFLNSKPYKLPLVIVDKNLEKNSKHINKFLKKLDEKIKYIKIFYDYNFEPTYSYLDKLNKKIKMKKNHKKIDIIISIGGGSTIDSGKGISILLRNKGKPIKFMGFPKNIKKPLPLIAVPSTTGTGSEVAFNASFVDNKKKIKMGINSPDNYPILSILDQKIVQNMPIRVLKSSGSDLIVHTLESFMSTKKTSETEFFSILAFVKIKNSFKRLIVGKGDLNDWENLQWACVWSMIAMANSSAGPSSAFSYLLGTHFNVPHGIAGAFFLKKIIFYNIKHNYKFKKLFPNKKIISKKFLENYFNNLFNLCEIPDNISFLGVNKEKDFKTFSDFYKVVVKTFSFNPIKITKKEFLKIIFE